MEINVDLVRRLAQLSKLEFAENELNIMRHDLQKVLDMVEKLNEVDTSNVQPLKNVHELVNVFRSDDMNSVTIKQDILKNAPLADDNYFKVPKIIQK